MSVTKLFRQFAFVASLLWMNIFFVNAQPNKNISDNKIDLSGTWQFKTDPAGTGITEQWYLKKMKGLIHLPGSMTTNNIGDDISINTPWTGEIVDSSWFFKKEYARYRQPGNLKIPFWLQPVKYYKGFAWYQKEITIPAGWNKKNITLFLERCHWKTSVWMDNTMVGTQNALGAPHVYDLTSFISPGKHRLTICISNKTEDINIGINSHSITDHTQTNWNGIIGKICLIAQPSLSIDDVQLFPDIQKKQVVAFIKYKNTGNKTVSAQVSLMATCGDSKAEKPAMLHKEQTFDTGNGTIELTYNIGNRPLLWDEFHPNLYSMKVTIKSNGTTDEKNISFGMRSFSSENNKFAINGRPVFLRGTLECAVFPLTGYPSTKASDWKHIFAVCKAYGLNHIRFHSWCPPSVAFDEADSSGFYLQVECSSWAQEIGDGKPVDQFIYDESERIVRTYGNHPSFCMMDYGNEPGGKNLTAFLTKFVTYWKMKDPRRLYTTASGWPIVDESDYNCTPDPRIQLWGDGLKSIINAKPPCSNYDWNNIIAKWKHPTVSHEIGQWCAYPDFKEMALYTGILQPKNFEIFKETLADNGMKNLADSFLLASGKLQALCYKADIEAALRTKNFGGFQLLGLNDFPGQGTALVGVVNAFWKDKGYITAKEYSRFCNATVPLARFSTMIWQNNMELIVPVEIAHYGEMPLKNLTPSWVIKNAEGKILFQGKFPQTTIPAGNAFQLGEIRQSLSSIQQASKLILTVTVASHQNSWDFFVYPANHPEAGEDIYVTQQFNDEAIRKLNESGKVLLTLKKGSVKKEKGGSIAVGFSSIFWNTAWTENQPPHTLGILCNPQNPALTYFPTDYYSNWQWWDAVTNSDAMMLDSISHGLKPIVRIIDDWFTNRSLGLLFECRVGKGKLIVSSIDLLSNINERPVARQLLYSLKKYMETNQCNPGTYIDEAEVKDLLNYLNLPPILYTTKIN